MGLSVPGVMADLEDVKKTVPEDEGCAPESWEMVDLEENMKKLLASPQVVSSQVSVEPCISNESNGLNTGLLPFRTDSADLARGPDQVDGFLKEALQNPRDRLTSKQSIYSRLLSYLSLLFSFWILFSNRKGHPLVFLLSVDFFHRC